PCFWTICLPYCSCSFLSDPATTEIYTLSLHDALPISGNRLQVFVNRMTRNPYSGALAGTVFTTALQSSSIVSILTLSFVNAGLLDRKSTRLNSSHVKISYAVFCLKKKRIK